MMKLGFVQGKSNPCIYYHQKRDLRTVDHGDDFTTAGSYENIKWLHEALGKEWMVVERGILGPPGTPNTIQDIRVLYGIISWKDEGVWWEPDSRHADLVVEILEPKIGKDGRAVSAQASKVKTPIAKPTAEDIEKDKEFPWDHAEALGRLSMLILNIIGYRNEWPRGTLGSRKLEPTICWQMCLRNPFRSNDEQSTFGYELSFPRRTASIITQEMRWLESGYYFPKKKN